MDCKDRFHLMTSSDSNPSRIGELNRVSLQLGQACPLHQRPAFVLFLDLFEMFAAIPSAMKPTNS